MSRLAVTDRNAQAAGQRLAHSARQMFGAAADGIDAIVATQLYLIDRSLTVPEQSAISAAIIDDATQTAAWTVPDGSRKLPAQTVEVALRPGVTDPVGEAFSVAVTVIGLPPVNARAGTRFQFVSSQSIDSTIIERITNGLLHNDIVDEVSTSVEIVPKFADQESIPDNTANTNTVEIVPVRTATNSQMEQLSKSRGLALDPAELVVVQTFFRSIDRDPTDAELETIAQTWSEHCSHKTFRAHIKWEDGTEIMPLLKQLRKSTDEINAPFVKSAFVDNAGIISFDDRYDVAIKVETHNHPSAVEPFGGANTGVGGVIRDVLGVAADPIATTDILCFGPLDTPAESLPKGVLHPQRIRDGVVAGVADYGNKLGLPTVAGAIVHQEGFTANPLVFCGCIGLRPAGLVLTGQQPGERIVAIGGATGRDGIRGATFSSATMDATTGDVAGASVQIGDPIIEKLVADVLRDARDCDNGPLFTAITDCGAGGFSSAIGEIAAELGADVNLDVAPRKYPGLAPWEVWLSEAQERMVLAVKVEHLSELQLICDAHGVLMADVGQFRSDGQLIVRCAGEKLVDLPGSFLHDGRPTRQMIAAHPIISAPTDVRDADAVLGNLEKVLLDVLAHSDVRSNEDVVRGYDHEILGATIGRPYLGAADDGPSDAAVLAPLAAAGSGGLAIGIGLNCRSGVVDSYRLAGAAIDEAIRNIVCVGANPDQVVLLDNFSWGDPRRPEMLGRLVDAVRGCVEGADAFRAPFVSGKDSLNNEYETADGSRRSIPPTLVITALGIVPNAEALITSDAKRAGNVLVLVGPSGTDLRGSVLDCVLGIDGHGDVPGAEPTSPATYRSVHAVMEAGLVLAAHDVSDGGLLTTAAEMAIGGRLGVSLKLEAGSADVTVNDLFGESSGRILLEVGPDNVAFVCARTNGSVIGSVTDDRRLIVAVEKRQILDTPLSDLLTAWRGHVEAAS
jgi:phosphoribosylformylglycinamidine synthase subunit PurSL